MPLTSKSFYLFRDYGLHPGISNSGEDNFLLAHLFVGASHTNVM